MHEGAHPMQEPSSGTVLHRSGTKLCPVAYVTKQEEVDGGANIRGTTTSGETSGDIGRGTCGYYHRGPLHWQSLDLFVRTRKIQYKFLAISYESGGEVG